MLSNIKKLMIAFTGAAMFYAQDVTGQNRNPHRDRPRHDRDVPRHDHDHNGYDDRNYYPYGPQPLPVVIIQPASVESQLLGTWSRRGYDMTEIEFLPNGRIRTYEDGMLESTGRYSITNRTPDDFSRAGDLFLKININGDATFYRINSLDPYNNGVLSLTSMDDGETMNFRRDYAPGFAPQVMPGRRY